MLKLRNNCDEQNILKNKINTLNNKSSKKSTKKISKNQLKR